MFHLLQLLSPGHKDRHVCCSGSCLSRASGAAHACQSHEWGLSVDIKMVYCLCVFSTVLVCDVRLRGEQLLQAVPIIRYELGKKSTCVPAIQRLSCKRWSVFRGALHRRRRFQKVCSLGLGGFLLTKSNHLRVGYRCGKACFPRVFHARLKTESILRSLVQCGRICSC